MKSRISDPNVRGFTLIELLVVITIVGILATIVVFAVSGLGDASGDATCRADAASLTDAEDTAMAAVGQYLPQDELLAQKFLKNPISSYTVLVTGGGTAYSLTQVESCEEAFGGGSGVGGTSPTSVPPSSTTTPPVSTTTLPDTTPPALAMTSCAENGNSNKWRADGSRGTAPGDLPTVTVTITGPQTSTQSATGSAASWSVGPSANAVALGTYTCTATQADDAGNVATVTLTLII